MRPLSNLAVLALCTAPALAADPPAAGAWRAWLDGPGGEIPFGLVLMQQGPDWTAAILNGDEQITGLPVTLAEDGSLSIAMHPYDSVLEARVTEEGKMLSGEWVKPRGDAASTRMPFHASHGAQPRFREVPRGESKPDLDGRWSVQFAADGDPSVGVFRTREGILHGTFLTTLGDYRYLAGHFDGKRALLSVFDGAHAFRFRATLQEDGTLKGDFWSRDTWHDTWTAKRDADAALPDPYELTKLVDPAPLGKLEFPDVDGTPRKLSDEAFAGKARLIVLFGTWCPNCFDETRYLKELHQRYADKGLSILGLAFELGDDPALHRGAVQRYVQRMEVPYPVLVAGPSDKARATELFPVLDRVRSYPTTLFLDAAGKVHAIHTGFSGPATGPAHQRLRDSFETRIGRLLSAEDR